MSKIIYITSNKDSLDQVYNLVEDTIIYHFSCDCSSKLEIHLKEPGITFYYYYSTINYNDNKMAISVYHDVSNTNSYLYNHGVNVYSKKLDFDVSGYVPKTSSKCICNQENQIVNLDDGMSSIFPKLYIDNYDVDSNHAAYIGPFSEDDLFYLMSRGISLKVCNELLLRGFLLQTDSVESGKIGFFIEELEKI